MSVSGLPLVCALQAPLALTPYASETLIDANALGVMIEEAYAQSGLTADTVDAGAVILTGEALRRENGEAIAGMLAEQGGEFVCATAGHHMESRLAVFGSGAARRSFDEGSRILNIDIGGGTTKLGLVDHGELVATAAVHTGGRLIVVGEGGRIERLDPQGRDHARRAGFDWALGTAVTREQMTQVAAGMEEGGTRETRHQAVVARDHRSQYAGGVARSFLRRPRVPFDQRDGHAACRQTFGNRTASQSGADHGDPLRWRELRPVLQRRGTGARVQVADQHVAFRRQAGALVGHEAGIAQRLAHRSRCGGHGIGEIALVKEAARLAAAGSHRGRI